MQRQMRMAVLAVSAVMALGTFGFLGYNAAILLGAAKPAHVMTPSSTVRRIVNMTALAVADATEAAGGAPARVPTMEHHSTLGAANAA